MMQEKQRVDRRQVGLHETADVGLGGGAADGLVGDAADVVVDFVVRLTFEHAETGQHAVRLPLRAGKSQKVSRRESILHHRQRDRFCRSLIELRFLPCQAAHMRRLEEALAPRIVDDVEPEIVGESDAAGEELAILGLLVEFAIGIDALPTISLRHHVPEPRLEVVEPADVGGMARREHVVEHDIGNPRLLGPIPIGQREVGISAQLAADLLEPADVAAVPNQEPPVAVRTVRGVCQGVAIPIARIGGRQRKHRANCLLVAFQRARRLRIGEAQATVFRRRLRQCRVERQRGRAYGGGGRAQKVAARHAKRLRFFRHGGAS